MWHQATGGKGAKDMVVLPYKDRLLLLGRYLQQLIMESLGKRLNLRGERVDQGLTVYGNKGSTDQHAYVQQLRDGVNNFFVVFVRVLESGGCRARSRSRGDQRGLSARVPAGNAVGAVRQRPGIDHDHGAEGGSVYGGGVDRVVRAGGWIVRESGGHQCLSSTGVEAGKKAAAAVLDLQRRILGALAEEPRTAEALAAGLGASDQVETIYLQLEHLAANGRAEMQCREGQPGLALFAKKPASGA
jgi:glucose-6-phosphate isomerase